MYPERKMLFHLLWMLWEIKKGMKEKISLVIKGFILGVANVIPGVSGGTLAITMGIYERLIDCISHFFKNIKKNLGFIIPIGIGAVLSVLIMSKVITISLEKFPLATTLFFIGLIVGGVPMIAGKVRKEKIKPVNIIVFLITFGIIMFMTFGSSGSNNIDLSNVNIGMMLILFLVGVVASATMVIPGVSGSFVLMLLGFYEPVFSTVSNLTNFSQLGHNLLVLCPFGIGVLIGFVLVAKLIEFLLSKFRVATYYGILGFVISSIVGLFVSVFGFSAGVVEIIIGIVLFLVGTFVGYKLGDE